MAQVACRQIRVADVRTRRASGPFRAKPLRRSAIRGCKSTCGSTARSEGLRKTEPLPRPAGSARRYRAFHSAPIRALRRPVTRRATTKTTSRVNTIAVLPGPPEWEKGGLVWKIRSGSRVRSVMQSWVPGPPPGLPTSAYDGRPRFSTLPHLPRPGLKASTGRKDKTPVEGSAPAREKRRWLQKPHLNKRVHPL